jgi:hypothetical protein
VLSAFSSGRPFEQRIGGSLSILSGGSIVSPSVNHFALWLGDVLKEGEKWTKSSRATEEIQNCVAAKHKRGGARWKRPPCSLFLPPKKIVILLPKPEQ